jgi:hypothetical protein
MKKIFTVLLVSVISLSMKSQWVWDYGVAIGSTNYLGDIGGKDKERQNFISDVQLAKTRYNIGGFVRYKWRPKVSLKMALDYVRIEADDKLSTNPGRKYRNFNFRNNLFDLGLTGELFFFENNDLGHTYKYRNGFRAYVFGGVGAFLSNPKTLYQGDVVALRPYATEGVKYKALNFNIPMGIGFYFTIDKTHRIGFELNYRKTFTDYIDDISGNYPEKPADTYEQGLILRTSDLPAETIADNPGAAASHNWGMKRGDKTHKDAYMTLNLSYSYVLRGKSSFYRARSNGIFGKGKKRKMRKIRAKF